MKAGHAILILFLILIVGWLLITQQPNTLERIGYYLFSKDKTYSESLRFSPQLVEQKRADGSRLISAPAHKFQFVVPKEYDGAIEPSSGSISDRKWQKNDHNVQSVNNYYLEFSFSALGIFLEPIESAADMLGIKNFTKISGTTYEAVRSEPRFSGVTWYILVLFKNPLDKTHVLMRIQVVETDIATYQNTIDTILSSFSYTGIVDFGTGSVLSGRVLRVTGDCTPPSNLCTYKGLRSTVLVYDEMTEGTAEVSKIKVASIETDADGKYSLKLAPGHYSIMVLTGEKEECALKDGGGHLCPVTVKTDPVRYDPWVNRTQKL